MSDAMRARLERYCLIPAMAGHEDRMVRAMAADLSGYVDRLHVDAMGNLIATIDGTDPDAPSVMVFAHTDQIGMVVRSIAPDGYLGIERVGGVPERVLAGSVVHVGTVDAGLLPGVIGTVAHHLTPDDAKYVVRPIREMYLDIGAVDAAEVERLGVVVGAPVVYEPRFTRLAGDRIVATSVDDRGGCAALVEVALRLASERPAATVHVVGSAQEEFNLRGAMVAAQSLQPDLAISVDLVVACDTPDLRGHSDVRLGGGPVLGTYTFHGRGTLNGLIPHPGLVRAVERCAEEEGIRLQRNASVGMLTDASYVQLVGEGIPSIDMAWPTRYTHTGVEMSDLRDLDALARLLEGVIRRLPRRWDAARVAL
jgi:putative aminopeptidase